jgi:hypothetical protein
MTSRSWLLAGLAVAVVALLVGLLLALRAEDPPRDPVAQDTSPAPAPPPAPRPPPAEPTDRRPVPLPPLEPGETLDERGRIVRDHRGAAGPTGPASPIASLTLAHVRQAVEPQIRACAQELLDPTPIRITITARLRVAGDRVTASDVILSDREKLGDAYVTCVQRAYAELTTDPPDGQREVEELVHMPWTVP